MINANIRTYRPGRASAGMRQRVVSASRAGHSWSAELIQRTGIVLVAVLVVVMAVGQFLQWQIGSADEQVNRLQGIRSELGSRHITLLATRARLTSRQHIEAVAAVKFGLSAPKNGQVHHL